MWTVLPSRYFFLGGAGRGQVVMCSGYFDVWKAYLRMTGSKDYHVQATGDLSRSATGQFPVLVMAKQGWFCGWSDILEQLQKVPFPFCPSS